MDILRKNDLAGLEFSGLFLVAVIFIAWAALERIETQARASSGEAIQTVLGTTQEALYIWIAQRRRNALELASRPELRELTKSLLAEPRNRTALAASPHQEKLRKFMRPRLLEYTDDDFFIIGPDRINIASNQNESLGEQNLIYRQRPEYLERLFQGHVSFVPTIIPDVPMSDRRGKLEQETPAIFVGSPVHDANGEIIAVIALRMNPYLHFIRITQLGRIGKTGETYAFDKQGRLISESRFDQQLRRAGLVKRDGNGVPGIRIEDPGGNLLKGFASKQPEDKRELTLMAKSAVAGKSGFSVDGYRDYRGVQVFGAWLWDSSLGFGLATEIDEDEAMQPFFAIRQVILLVLAATVVLSFAFAASLIWVRKQSIQSLEKAYTELEVRVDERTLELKNARDGLEVANRKLAVQATTDPLTGLSNRRSLDQHLGQEWLRCQRYDLPLSILMLDIDFFKAYNDLYGHPAGDECLIKVAIVLGDTHIASRPGDMVARYGGEEFLVLLTGTPNKEAIKIAEQIKAMLLKERIQHEASAVSDTGYITASIGVATETDCSKSTPQSLINRVDKALYAAKEQGRNRIVTYQDHFS